MSRSLLFITSFFVIVVLFSAWAMLLGLGFAVPELIAIFFLTIALSTVVAWLFGQPTVHQGR